MANKKLEIRLATPADLGDISDIYNHYVVYSTATYQIEPETLEDRRIWFANHAAAHPVTVAQLDGRTVGWGSLTRFHARAAYDATVENSVYVHPEFQRQGVGRALLADLIARASAIGHHTIIAGISADQVPSMRLHEVFGFVEVARLREVGFKYGRWLDVIYMQLML